MEKGKIPVSERVLAAISKLKLTDGERATVLRRRNSLTLSDVAAAIGAHEHRISEMERGIRDVSAEYVAFLQKL